MSRERVQDRTFFQYSARVEYSWSEKEIIARGMVVGADYAEAAQRIEDYYEDGLVCITLLENTGISDGTCFEFIDNPD